MMCVDSGCSGCSFGTRNYPRVWPLQVPSAFLLTDVSLAADVMLNRKLFKLTDLAESKASLAGCEGLKLKKLVSSLRALWRSSRNGHDPRVTELKSYLRASPTPRRRLAGESSDEEMAARNADDEPAEDGEAGGEPLDDDDDDLPAGGDLSDDGEAAADDDLPAGGDLSDGEAAADDHLPAGSEPSDDEAAANDDLLAGSEPSDHGDSDDDCDGQADPGSKVGESKSLAGRSLQRGIVRLDSSCQLEDSAQVAQISSQDSLLAASTMCLDDARDSGEELDSSDGDDLPDSQVSSGWLGKAYNLYNALEKEERENKKKEEDKEILMGRHLGDIRRGLEAQTGAEIEGTTVWSLYSEHCRCLLKVGGIDAYDHLRQFETFNEFIQTQKTLEDPLGCNCFVAGYLG